MVPRPISIMIPVMPQTLSTQPGTGSRHAAVTVHYIYITNADLLNEASCQSNTLLFDLQSDFHYQKYCNDSNIIA
jgi:hypothetical protein